MGCVMTLETDRLTLRGWEPDDFEASAAMSAEPEVMKFIAFDGKPAPRKARRCFRTPGKKCCGTGCLARHG